MHFGEAINSCWLRAFGIDVLINFVSKVTIFLQFSEKSATSPKIEERLKKNPIPGGLHSRVVYNFTCAGCNVCYVGETTRHFSTRVREHLAVDKASHIFKHLQNSERCRALCTIDCFHILDHATTSFQLKIKEAIHIHKELPCLNQQLHHVNLKLSF